MREIAGLLEKQVSASGILLDQKQLGQFVEYGEFLVEYNEKVNLTAITDPAGIAYKHFFDSLLLTVFADIFQGAKLVDVGTGAGFPSVPVKIVRPDLKLTLLDSLNKRIVFLDQLVEKLGLSDVHTVHARAEEAGRKAEYREKFDMVTARAVAHLRELSEYCLPFVKVGGAFAALKGYDIEQELSESKNAIKLLGGEVAEVKKYTLPDEEQSKRSLVIIKKISHVLTNYPRPSAKMTKKPL